MILSKYPDCIDPVSGIFYKRIVDELLAKCVKVIVISPKPKFKNINSANRKEAVVSKEATGRNLRIFRPAYFPLPTSLSRRMKVYLIKRSIVNCINRNHLSFDIVDSRYAFPWCYVGSLIAGKYNKPSVSTFIGDDINKDIFSSDYVFNCTKWVIGRSSNVTVSTDLKLKTEKYFDAHNVSVVYDGINFNNLNKSVRPNNDTRQLKDQLTIGFVGQLTVEKGCKTILEVIKRTNNKYHWIIVGEGPLFKEFEKHLNVQLTGKISPELVFEYYSQMDLFLFPSQNEGIPNVLKEAAYCELPIIASAVGGIPEMTNSGQFATLLRSYVDADEVIKLINDFIANKAKYHEKALHLKEYVICKFDISSNVEKLISLYKTAISARP